MLGGGSDREWTEPLAADGNRRNIPLDERVVGCHTGNYIGLNVVNPQPGFEYAWYLSPSRSGASPADAFAIYSVGGHVVNETDPERAYLSKIEGLEGTPIDTS